MNVALRPEPHGPSGDPGPLDVISLCTGGFGLDLALGLAVPGARSVCLVEREAFAVAHLVSAMGQGLIHPAPVWSDARTFDGRAWRGCVDGVIGGIPCQPHSLAGRKQGSLDARDLWSDARRIIVQSRAWFVLIENVVGMLSAGADEIAGAERVRRDLLKMGFAVEGGLFTASEVGASHERERLFILGVADAGGAGSQGRELGGSSGKRHGPEASRPVAELCGASLVHPECAEWRPDAVGRHERHGTDGGWDQAAGRARKSGEAMGDALGVDCERRRDTTTWNARAKMLKSRHGNSNGAGKPLTIQSQEMVSSLPDRPISTGGDGSSHIRRTLNPLFVEWLMGWPRGWTSLVLTLPGPTACGCSATALSLWKAHMRSALSALGLPDRDIPEQASLFG